MFGMAFALFAVALVVAVLFLSVANLHARYRDVEQRLNTTVQSSTRASPAAVTAAIEDLRTALAQVQATNRREFGAIWKRVGLSRAAAVEEVAPKAANDDAFDALIALQSADPVKPE